MKSVLLIVSMILSLGSSFAAQVKTDCAAANGFAVRSSASVGHKSAPAPQGKQAIKK